MDTMKIKQLIEDGKSILGIELGSTRIKAVLIGPDHTPIASGDHTWENQLENGVWTYHLEDVWVGIQDAYANLSRDVQEKYQVKLEKLQAIGISAMMHGYLPFDAEDNQICEFRTWRNTMTEEAAAELTELFSFNIPQRWSIAHLYQAMLKKETHLTRLHHLTTLAGYVHWQLTGEKVLGTGEASGMFPLDSVTFDYDQKMVALFDGKAQEKGYSWKLKDILPKVVNAGQDAGKLTEKGAKLLDPSGILQPGALAASPEGDAGTGMVATNSVAARTGNVSAGTSIFAMIVLENPLSKVYPEIDMVTTPTGKPVAMVHCNNCTNDINAWAGILKGFADAAGLQASMNDIYTAIFRSAMDGEKDCGGFININYLSGEPVTGLAEGRPMMLRTPEARITFQNFARSLLSGAVVSLKIGMDILEKEQVKIDRLLGHGGYFKTKGTGQNLLAAALNTPVTVMETAGEGGPWGMALLAAYRAHKQNETLEEYLNEKVFSSALGGTAAPDADDAEGFNAYTIRFIQSLSAQKAAAEIK